MRILSAMGLGAALLAGFPAGAKQTLTITQPLTPGTGGFPQNPPILASDGNLYGMNGAGGFGDGTLYSIHTDGTGFTVLYALGGGANGQEPFGKLVQAPNGLLYGTTIFGGQSAQGEVFTYDIKSGTFTVVHSFDVADGSGPYDGLVLDAQGNLYGTTSAGGAHGMGTVFSIAAGTNNFTVLASLSNATGYMPFSPLVIGADGMLYGTGWTGGKHDKGTIFRLATTGGAVTNLYDFGATKKDGALPFAGMVLGRNGLLYGTTDNGGVGAPFGHGVLFQFNPSTASVTVLHRFANTAEDGACPQGGVTVDGNGNLVGTTVFGGIYGSGTIWTYDLKKQKYTVLVNTLALNTGGLPEAGLTYGGKKIFYGGLYYYHDDDVNDGALFRFTE
jgi:uncharacterized repeat protein (TIGR03803 family)